MGLWNLRDSVTVAPVAQAVLDLAVPAHATLRRAVCGAVTGPADADSGVVHGVIYDAEEK